VFHCPPLTLLFVGSLHYMIVNLGISPNFGAIDFEHLTFPMVMSVDYIRVYQRPEDVNAGCDPDGFPTQSYINQWVSSFSTHFRQLMPSPLSFLRVGSGSPRPTRTRTSRRGKGISGSRSQTTNSWANIDKLLLTVFRASFLRMGSC